MPIGHRRPPAADPFGLTKLATIFQASSEVTQAIFFAATIIIAGFLPLFTLSGVEGHIFGPMAAPTPMPCRAACSRPSPSRRRCRRCCCPTRSHTETRIVRAIAAFYGGCATSCCARRGRTLAGLASCGRVAILAGSSIGLEFLPKLEEGNMWIRAVMPASISLEAGNDYANRMRR